MGIAWPAGALATGGVQDAQAPRGGVPLPVWPPRTDVDHRVDDDDDGQVPRSHDDASLEATLHALVVTYVGLYIYPTAIFYAEQLQCLFPSLDSLHLLATTLQRAGDAASAFRLLQHHLPSFAPVIQGNHTAAQLLYLLGVTAAMTRRYDEAEKALIRLENSGRGDGASAYWLAVCARGKRVPDAGGAASGAAPWLHAVECDPLNIEAVDQAAAVHCGAGGNPSPTQADAMKTLAALSSISADGSAWTSPLADVRPRSGSRVGPFSSSLVPRSDRIPTVPDADMRSCGLRFLAPFVAVMLAEHHHMHRRATSIASSLRKREPLTGRPNAASGWLMMRAALSEFHCGDNAASVSTFNALRASLPWRLNDLGWVSYSTALWLSKGDGALSAFAQQLIDAMPDSAITMAVTGNAYSLSRDPKTAELMFRRASQADPLFGYASCLRGHELLALDQTSEAEHCFRDAMRLDPRSYAAAAGIGECYLHNGHDAKAISYFQMAIDINRHPSILVRLAGAISAACGLGPGSSDPVREAQDRQQRLHRARLLYEQALEVQPTSVAARHHLALTLLRLGHAEDARQRLEVLVEDCPDESLVHLSLGKCLGCLRQPTRAVAELHRAMELDPRRAPAARALVDRLSTGALSLDDIEA